MTPGTLTIDKILTLLAETPQRIAAFTKGLTAVQLRTKPNPEEWSANEVLAHLRSCADVWGNCIEVILTQDEPTIRAINPRTWIERTDYLEQDFPSALRAFTKQRKKLLAILEPLRPEDWLRKATVTGAGKPLVRTVRAYAEWMATHERPHVKQIGRIASTVRE
jgi:hypothetical protein